MIFSQIAQEMPKILDCFGQFFMQLLCYGSFWRLRAFLPSNSHGWSSLWWVSSSIWPMYTVTLSVIKMPNENGQLGLLHNQHLAPWVALLEDLLERCSHLVWVDYSVHEDRKFSITCTRIRKKRKKKNKV